MPRTGGAGNVFRSIGYRKYRKTPAGLFSRGKNTVAVIRSAGAISRGGGATSDGITPQAFIKSIRQVKKNKQVSNAEKGRAASEKLMAQIRGKRAKTFN